MEKFTASKIINIVRNPLDTIFSFLTLNISLSQSRILESNPEKEWPEQFAEFVDVSAKGI